MIDNLALGFALTHYLHLLGIAASQRHLEVHDTVFYRVVEGGIEDGLYGDTVDETHLYDTLAERAMAGHTDHHTTLTCL